MNSTLKTHLTRRFTEMGARLKLRRQAQPRGRFRWRSPTRPVRIDVLSDKKGEYFDFFFSWDFDPEETQVQVLDVQPKDRHLLMMLKTKVGNNAFDKDKILCGHDERHWFAAGVPQSSSTVNTAIELLKPPEIREAQARRGGKRKNRNKRKNDTFLRQGEWFFIPQIGMAVPDDLVLHNEPLSRGRGSKPHNMEFCHRSGGTTVYVSHKHPTGITQEQYNRLSHKEKNGQGWQVMVRDAGVYAKGRISHADHATIVLPCWHQVHMNTESNSPSGRVVAFLD